MQGKTGLAKNKEQLKMLFFNPGKKIPGIPFIGDKLDVFDEGVARHYNFAIDTADLNGQPCYVFSIQRKDDLTAGEKMILFLIILLPGSIKKQWKLWAVTMT